MSVNDDHSSFNDDNSTLDVVIEVKQKLISSFITNIISVLSRLNKSKNVTDNVCKMSESYSNSLPKIQRALVLQGG